MILDAQGLLSDAQALTVTAVSTNTYDSGAAGNDITVGEPLVMVIQVDVAADFTTTDETYQFTFIQSANAALTSETTLVSRTIAASLLTAGSIHIVPIPQGAKTQRYVGARYVLAGTTPTVTVTSFIQPASMIQRDVNYADGITIS